MTIVAWDGKVLAADKRFSVGGLARTGTKIFRVGDSIVGFAGSAAQGMEMLEWLRGGEDPEEFPASQRDTEQNVNTLIIRPNGAVEFYEHAPYPIPLSDPFTAMGSGRDYAIAAMHLGKSAREAVEIACVYEIDCGGGIDTLELR